MHFTGFRERFPARRSVARCRPFAKGLNWLLSSRAAPIRCRAAASQSSEPCHERHPCPAPSRCPDPRPLDRRQAHARHLGPLRRRLHAGDGRARLSRPVRVRRGGRPCRRRRESRVSRLGGDNAALARPRDVPVQGAARAARGRNRHRRLARARQGALRRRRRACARHRDRRIRVRRAAAPQDRVHRIGRHRTSMRTRCASRSASSPASRRSTFRRWFRCGCFRWRSCAATPSC